MASINVFCRLGSLLDFLSSGAPFFFLPFLPGGVIVLLITHAWNEPTTNMSVALVESTYILRVWLRFHQPLFEGEINSIVQFFSIKKSGNDQKYTK